LIWSPHARIASSNPSTPAIAITRFILYVLLCALRRIGLHDTDFAKATCGTIRLKLQDRSDRALERSPHQDLPVRPPKTGPAP
jgi:hypothetical protein